MAKVISYLVSKKYPGMGIWMYMLVGGSEHLDYFFHIPSGYLT